MPDSLDVLLIMKRPGNLRVTMEALSGQDIDCDGVTSEDALEAMLEAGRVPRLTLVDVSGFGPAAWRMCARLQEHSLPFIVVFQPSEQRASNRSLQFGAMSVMQKPITKQALLHLIHTIVR